MSWPKTKSICSCVSVCLCMCLCCIPTCMQVHVLAAHIGKPAEDSGCLLLSLPSLVSWDRLSHWTILAVSKSPSLSCLPQPLSQHRHAGFSHGSRDLNSGLHVFSASALTHWPSHQPIPVLSPTRNRKLKLWVDWFSSAYLYKEPDLRIQHPTLTPIF